MRLNTKQSHAAPNELSWSTPGRFYVSYFVVLCCVLLRDAISVGGFWHRYSLVAALVRGWGGACFSEKESQLCGLAQGEDAIPFRSAG